MTDIATLKRILAAGKESECAEWKEAKKDFHSDDLGKYFSALSNEANLARKERAWFVMGVANDGTIVGTDFRNDPRDLDFLKHEIAQQVSNRLTFTRITQLFTEAGKRILLFEIPAALRGVPTSWKGHWYARDGASLVPLNLSELETIRAQAAPVDWSAEICEKATVNDLDPNAIKKGREEYAKKNAHLSEEMKKWDDITFLNKAKLAIEGKLTRAAIILLGKEEAGALISPATATITWILKDEKGIEKDYEHFHPPWILNGEKVYGKIRNLKYRQMPGGTLFPIEVDQYDPWVIREALHNSMAHQDYSKGARITVVEFPDKILLQNAGSFIPRSIEEVIKRDAPDTRYRNPFMCGAMVSFNMIDTIGSGIKKMFQTQRSRFFPLPEYELRPDSVTVTIMGQTLDPHYVQWLASNADLPLQDVMLLDQIQKKKPISKEAAKHLKNMGLVEGRYPNLHISAPVAALARQKATYLHNRGLDQQHYEVLITAHIDRFGAISRKEADELLIPKLGDVLREKQKKAKVHNILSAMVRDKTIKNIGSRARPSYIRNN